MGINYFMGWVSAENPLEKNLFWVVTEIFI